MQRKVRPAFGWNKLDHVMGKIHNRPQIGLRSIGRTLSYHAPVERSPADGMIVRHHVHTPRIAGRIQRRLTTSQMLLQDGESQAA